MMSKVIDKRLKKAENERRRKMEERIQFARLQMLVPAKGWRSTNKDVEKYSKIYRRTSILSD
jgi:hypothetical protein